MAAAAKVATASAAVGSLLQMTKPFFGYKEEEVVTEDVQVTNDTPDQGYVEGMKGSTVDRNREVHKVQKQNLYGDIVDGMSMGAGLLSMAGEIGGLMGGVQEGDKKALDGAVEEVNKIDVNINPE